MDPYTKTLERIYNNSLNKFTESDSTFLQPSHFDDQDTESLLFITNDIDAAKAVYTVLTASALYKIIHPNQDVRYHQTELPNGYSGRSFDTKYVTPFLKEKGLTHMAESGWLTRSLEQPYPYDLNYQGKIRNVELRKAFLDIMNSIEVKKINPEHVLEYLIQKAILVKKANDVSITRRENTHFTIADIISMLDYHFSKSDSVGTARLPVIAVYSIYECIVEQFGRYNNKKLKLMASHTSSDLRSGDIGDVQVNNSDGTEFEGVEVKYGRKITPQLMMDSYEKFKHKPSVERYYILSTIEPTEDEKEALKAVTSTIFSEHGAQFIANGLLDTIKYYLRLIENTDSFIDNYTANLAKDTVVKIEHKTLWKQLVESY